MLDERQLRALYHVQGYQRRVARAFNKHEHDVRKKRRLDREKAEKRAAKKPKKN